MTTPSLLSPPLPRLPLSVMAAVLCWHTHRLFRDDPVACSGTEIRLLAARQGQFTTAEHRYLSLHTMPRSRLSSASYFAFDAGVLKEVKSSYFYCITAPAHLFSNNSWSWILGTVLYKRVSTAFDSQKSSWVSEELYPICLCTNES
jgi:hypothetical protein